MTATNRDGSHNRIAGRINHARTVGGIPRVRLAGDESEDGTARNEKNEQKSSPIHTFSALRYVYELTPVGALQNYPFRSSINPVRLFCSVLS